MKQHPNLQEAAMRCGWIPAVLVAALGCRTSAVQKWDNAPLAPAIAFVERVPPRGVVVLALDAHSGKPLDYAVLRAAPAGGERTARIARADSAGRARLFELPTGRLSLSVLALGYRRWYAAVDVTDSAGVALVVQLRRNAAALEPVRVGGASAVPPDG